MSFDQGFGNSNRANEQGASVGVMPLSTYLNLRLGDLDYTKLTVELADRIVKHPKEIAENVLVGIVLKRNRVDDLKPTVKEGEVVDEPITDIVKTRWNFIGGVDDYLSDCDFDRRTHIDCAYNLRFSCMIGFEYVHANFLPMLPINVMSKRFYNTTMQDKIEFKRMNELGNFINELVFIRNFYVITDFTVVEDTNPYLGKEIGDVIVGEPFCKASCVEARRFDGIITIRDGNDSVTHQMVRSTPRFKHLINEKCNKIPPLLKGLDKFEEITWNDAHVTDFNAMTKVMKKSKYLKENIRAWIKVKKDSLKNYKKTLKAELAEIDLLLDTGEGNSDVFNKSISISKSLQKLDKLESIEYGTFPKGDNSSFIALIPKMHDTKMVKDFRHVTLIGSLYKIIAKILANHLVVVLEDIVNEVGNSSFIALIPKMHDAKMVKDFRPITLIGSLYNIIAKILENRLVVVLGDIIDEVQFTFIANRRILDGPFIINELFHWCKKKKKLTMIFKVDFEKAYYLVRWDYLDDVLKFFGFCNRWCGYCASGNGKDWLSDARISFLLFRVEGGRLTFLKSVLGLMPIYHMSLFKVPMKVLQRMESIRCYFFNGVDHNGSSLWARVIKGIHGEDGKLGKHVNHSYLSIWLDIIREMEQLKNHGTDLICFIHKKIGNRADTSFWEDVWRGDGAFKSLFVEYMPWRLSRMLLS
uniref:RNA-directed DNA polymerase, eukaryota, reverse transcriptase zinc-binding domain protein n=1 Tax=Tanacetum cinerariifolium TaxID=118510 RepID=A0A6L2MDM1_TANCI|nr:RNA-directed DNA polymerase, eukaryota, reverse transcriptase zinc-binding domain protein [Tanacetum cinerariifolium]